MKSYKEKQFLVFEFEDGKKVKYNLATGESIGKSGKVVKDVCTQLRGYSLLDVIESFEDEKYRDFLKFVDSEINVSAKAKRYNYKNKERVEKVKNIGTFLKQIKEYSLFEQYFACGLTNFSTKLSYKVTDIPKGLLKLIREENLTITNTLIESYIENPDLFMNIHNLEGLYTLNKKDLYCFALSLRYFRGNLGKYMTLNKRMDIFVELVEDYYYNPISLIKYIDTLITLEALSDIATVLIELYDYARMMSKVSNKYDKYPRNFLTTHQIATRNYNRLKEKFDEEDFKARYNDSFNFEWEDFIITYPKSTQDVKDEAVQQNHCVASYIRRVINGECHILFLREKENPDKSLITLELRENKVVQARGKFNRETTKEEREVVEKYEKVLERRLKVC